MLRNRFRRSYWYRNVAHFALVLLEHTWNYAILKLHLKLLKLHLKLLKLHWLFQIVSIFFEICWCSKKQKMLFDFFQVFQKVFPRIPGGCRHQESAGNRVLDKCYRSLCDTCFWNVWDCFWKIELFKIIQKTFLKWNKICTN